MKKLFVEDWIRVIAGTMILLSLSLGLLISKWWFLLTGFVGVNLIQSVFTGFCLAGKILKNLGVPSRGDSCCSGDRN